VGSIMSSGSAEGESIVSVETGADGERGLCRERCVDGIFADVCTAANLTL
jgi:hypothetical protein